MRYEVRIAGSGGQGVVLAGVVLGRAAALYSGKRATQTQSYGPEARGGSCKSEVVISESPVDFPLATKLDALVVMNQESLKKYLKDLKPGGVLLADSSLIKEIPAGDYQVYPIPGTEMAEKQLNNRIVANMIMLGAFSAATSAVTRDSLERAVSDMVPQSAAEVNVEAIRAGYQYVKSLTGAR